MKKVFHLFVILNLFQNFSAKAQINLVPNASFELIVNCPFPVLVSGDVSPWDSPSDGSPDDFNTCSPQFSSQGVPNSSLSYQQPRSGNGYLGALFFGDIYFREYMQVQLDSMLIANKKYCVSFYVNMANNFNKASNNIGMYFSSAHTYIPSTNYLNFIPQINHDSIVSDTANWTLISGNFIAQGGEKYIIIGNFFPDSACDTLNLNGTYDGAYYFVDDVDVHYCDPSGVNELSNEGGFEVYPNPSTGVFILESKNKISSIKVYNLLGEKIYNEELKETTTTTINLNAPPGVYFVEVTTAKGIQRKRIVMQ